MKNQYVNASMRPVTVREATQALAQRLAAALPLEGRKGSAHVRPQMAMAQTAQTQRLSAALPGPSSQVSNKSREKEDHGWHTMPPLWNRNSGTYSKGSPRNPARCRALMCLNSFLKPRFDISKSLITRNTSPRTREYTQRTLYTALHYHT